MMYRFVFSADVLYRKIFVNETWRSRKRCVNFRHDANIARTSFHGPNLSVTRRSNVRNACKRVSTLRLVVRGVVLTTRRVRNHLFELNNCANDLMCASY